MYLCVPLNVFCRCCYSCDRSSVELHLGAGGGGIFVSRCAFLIICDVYHQSEIAGSGMYLLLADRIRNTVFSVMPLAKTVFRQLLNVENRSQFSGVKDSFVILD